MQVPHKLKSSGRFLYLSVSWMLANSQAVIANEVNVVAATANCNANVCNISATLRHQDAGWDHYANHWRVLDKNGNELGRRVLAHPHENEQPFTRSLGGVKIPDGTDYLVIEAHDSVHEYGGETFEIKIP